MTHRKALFVHDHIFKKDQHGNYYSEGNITDSVFDRYKPCCSEIHVLSRCQAVENPKNLSKISSNNVQFHPIKTVSFPKAFTKHILSTTYKTFYLTKSNDFTIIRMPSFLGTLAYLTAKMLQRPYFIELVGDPKEAITSATKKKHFGTVKILANAMEKLTQGAVLDAPGVIYVTRESLQNKFPTKGFSSSASDVVLSIGEINLSYERYDLSKKKVRIGLIGSFKNNYKGIDTAITALAHLKSKSIICQLSILGSGNSAPYIKLASSLGVQDQVIFDGVLQQGSGVYTWLDNLDIYIQPSRTEGLPRALIEAMSRGLPCIGSNVGGIPELLPERWIFPKEEDMELAKKIESFIENQDNRYSAGRENFATSTEYSHEKLQEKRLNFWMSADSYIAKLPKK